MPMLMECTASIKCIGSSATAHWNRAGNRNDRAICSVDHLLQLLHGQCANSLGSRLGLEDAWLLGEWVDALASWACWLLLELQVQATTNLESAVLLQLRRCQLHIVGHDSLHILSLKAGLLSNSAESSGGSHGTTSLHGLHCLHSRSHVANGSGCKAEM